MPQDDDRAAAVKIYKVTDMEMKNRAGKYVMPDNPAFEPVDQDITTHGFLTVAN